MSFGKIDLGSQLNSTCWLGKEASMDGERIPYRLIFVSVPSRRFCKAGCRVSVPGAHTKAPRKPGRSQNSTGQCLRLQPGKFDLQELAGTCDGDRPRLHGLGNLAHELDVQEPVLQARALDLDIVGELEATLEGFARRCPGRAPRRSFPRRWSASRRGSSACSPPSRSRDQRR